MSGARATRSWVSYNDKTATYDTGDGTKVAAEVVDGVECLADLLRISQIRAAQREAFARATGQQGGETS